MSQKEILISGIVKYLNLLSNERLREVYDFVRFFSIESVEDFSLMKGVEILSQESLREFLESEPDIYSYDDIKERNG